MKRALVTGGSGGIGPRRWRAAWRAPGCTWWCTPIATARPPRPWRDRIVTLGPVVAADAKQTLGRCGIFPTHYVSPLLPVEQQAQQLRALRPDVFWVYPTALRALLHCVGALSRLIQPHMIVTSAEPLDEILRHKLASDRPVELRNFYGSVEVGRIGWECVAGEGLHINTDCTILELEEEGAVPGAGQSVVVTNLNSRASPYIRFRLGDLCEFM